MTTKSKKPASKSSAVKTPAKAPATKAPTKKWHPLPAKEFAERVKGKRISILAKANPKRGAGAKRFDLYKDGMTVEAALAAGVRLIDLQWDSSPHHRGGAYIAVR